MESNSTFDKDITYFDSQLDTRTIHEIGTYFFREEEMIAKIDYLTKEETKNDQLEQIMRCILVEYSLRNEALQLQDQNYKPAKFVIRREGSISPKVQD